MQILHVLLLILTVSKFSFSHPAGFDGYHSDPIGGELGLSTEDYVWCTKQVRTYIRVLHLWFSICIPKYYYVPIFDGRTDSHRD